MFGLKNRDANRALEQLSGDLHTVAAASESAVARIERVESAATERDAEIEAERDAIASREAAVKSREAAVKSREAAVKSKEAEVRKRERAVTKQERTRSETPSRGARGPLAPMFVPARTERKSRSRPAATGRSPPTRTVTTSWPTTSRVEAARP
ncbi:hypothetical protein [Thermocrispum municipale]|uniref:hypothetical protein n=1 Tax=Thermocrispum municipale TaxID=37926 RepID=UPI0012EB985B|nr:hypothetical protein [Thermocrispum municipale]